MRRLDTYGREKLLKLVEILHSGEYRICCVCNGDCHGKVSQDVCYSNIVNYLTEEVEIKTIEEISLPTLADCIDLLKAYINNSIPNDRPLVLTPKYYKTIEKYLKMYINDPRPARTVTLDFDDIKYLYNIFMGSKKPQILIDKTDAEKLVVLLIAIQIWDEILTGL